jgi:hypothetical protein
LAADIPMLALALVAYGAGVGIASIARGTLPLAVFGPERYAVWIGRLAGPALLAGAVAPTLAAGLLDLAGPAVMLYVLEAFALMNIGVVLLLWSSVRRQDAEGRGG